MAAKQQGRDIHGILVLDKPVALSSNQALQQAKRVYQARKAGHTGSLDPFATGVLPICFGEATKISGLLLESDKSYRACLQLGAETSSGDPEGEIVRQCPIPELNNSRIEQAMQAFRGTIQQVPPMYSALKQGGKRLYQLARAGQVVERPARTVTIHELQLSAWRSPDLEFQVTCSKGTYIRSLAMDLAVALGSCGHLTALRRTGAGPFLIGQAITLDELSGLCDDEDALMRCLLPLDAGLTGYHRVSLEMADARKFIHGQSLASATSAGQELLCVYSPNGALLGLASTDAKGHIIPRRMFPGLFDI